MLSMDLEDSAGQDILRWNGSMTSLLINGSLIVSASHMPMCISDEASNIVHNDHEHGNNMKDVMLLCLAAHEDKQRTLD